MSWATLKTTTLIMSAMIGQAVAVEYLRGLPEAERKPAAARIRATLMAAVAEYAAGTVTSAKQTDVIAHQMMADEMGRAAEPALQRMLDMAAAPGTATANG